MWKKNEGTQKDRQSQMTPDSWFAMIIKSNPRAYTAFPNGFQYFKKKLKSSSIKWVSLTL